MPVGSCDEQPAVLMSDPSCNGLIIDSGFNRVRDEVMAHCMVGEVGQIGFLTCVFHRPLGARNAGNVVKATMVALGQLRTREEIAALRAVVA